MNFLNKTRQLINTPISGEQVYLFAFGYYFILSFLQTTTYIAYISENVIQKLSMLAIALVVAKIFVYDAKNIKVFFIYLIASFFLVVIWRTTHDVKFFSLSIFELGAKNVNFRKVIYLYFLIGLTFLIFTIGSSLFGIIKNLVYFRGTTNITRQSLGIIYPTDFAAHVLFLVLAYLYLRFEKLNFWDYLLVLISAIVLIAVSDARLSAYALILAIPIFYFGNRANHGNFVSTIIASFYWTVPIIAAYTMSFLTIFYNSSNSIMLKINHLLSDRLKFGSKAYDRYGVSILGQHVQEHGWGGLNGQTLADKSLVDKYFFIDSSFMRLLIIYGLLMTLIVVLVMTIISWRSIQTSSYALASVLVLVTLSAVVEQHLLELSYNPFLIALLANTTLPLVKAERRQNLEKLHG